MANLIKKCVLHGSQSDGAVVDLYPRTNLASVEDMTAFARTLNTAADAAAARNTLEVKDYIHPNSGVTAGTYREVTVNAQGHVIKGDNPILDISEGGTGASTVPAAIQALFGNTGIGTSKIPLYYDGTGFKACADAIGTGGIVASSLNKNGWIKFSNGLVVQWGKLSNINWCGNSYATPADTSGNSKQTVTLPVNTSKIIYIGFSYLNVTKGNRAYNLTAVVSDIKNTGFSVFFMKSQDGGNENIVTPMYFALCVI